MTFVRSALAALLSGLGAGLASTVEWALGQRMDVSATFIAQWATATLWLTLLGLVGAFLLRKKRHAFPPWSVVLALVAPVGLGLASNLTALRDVHFEPFSAPDLLERVVATLCGPVATLWASVGGTLQIGRLFKVVT
jgi:hypothetical protein